MIPLRTFTNKSGATFDATKSTVIFAEDLIDISDNFVLTDKLLNLSEGTMHNGKIVPSVVSGTLTVALKTLAGNDPSATDPIYIMIGGVVRIITSARYFTVNAVSNWLNLASAELSTHEVDLFVYLGWDTTDSVVSIMASRIPYAKFIGDFIYSGTAEKGIVGAYYHNVSTDPVVNIGRFATTLTGGAGSSWSVPTFTSSNLIQRPIYDTRYLSWQPVYSCSGSMTYTEVNLTSFYYKVLNDTVFLRLNSRGTTGGTTSNTIIASLPFSVGVFSGYFRNSGYVYDTVFLAGITILQTANTLGFLKYDSSNIAIGTLKAIGCHIDYAI